MNDNTYPFSSGAFGATKAVAESRNWNETNDLASSADDDRASSRKKHSESIFPEDAQTSRTSSAKKGDFQFPDRAVDLFGLFLDADIQQARQQAYNKIENNTFGATDQPFTQAAQMVQKTMVTLEAINIQAKRNHSQRSVQR